MGELTKDQLVTFARQKMGVRFLVIPPGTSKADETRMLEKHMSGWTDREKESFLFWYVMAK